MKIEDLPPRLTTEEVCELARYGPKTLWVRQQAGKMPKPVDRGGRGNLYDRDQVLKALRLGPESPPVEQEVVFDREAFRRAQAARKRPGSKRKPPSRL